MGTYEGILNPFDFQTLLINFFAGDMRIFLFIVAIVLAFIGAKFRMPNVVYGLLIVTFIVLFAQFYSSYLALSILIIGLIMFLIMVRPFKN